MRYFYFDAATGGGIQSSAAIEGDAEDIWGAWKSLSRQAGSFLGIYCTTGVVVQFIWDDSDTIIVDLPFPKEGGSMVKQLSYEECCVAITGICSGSDPEKIQGLEFVRW